MSKHSETATTWRAPLCRRPDEHPEVEHNWESLARLGKTCSCACHATLTDEEWEAWAEACGFDPYPDGNGRNGDEA